MSAHPDDLASVTAANRDRLMGVAAAISTITDSERDMIAATVDELAQIIRRVDGNHSLGAGELAEAILANLPQRAVSDELADLEAKARAATKDWAHRTTADDAAMLAAKEE